MNRTTTLCLLLLLLLTSLAARAQAPAWQAAVSVGGSGSYSATTSAITSDGELVYIAGIFTGSMQVGNTILTSTGEKSGFVAQWSTVTNTFVWAVRLSSGSLEPTAIAAFFDSVFITGRFTGATTFPGHFVNTTLTSAGGNDAFIAKISTFNGSLAWAYRAGGVGDDEAVGVQFVGPNVYITGNFEGTANFGSYTQTSYGLKDAFVAKLNDSGSAATFAWATHHGGQFSDYASGIAIKGSSLYVVGGFQWPSQFGSITLNTSGGFAGYVAKITDSGGQPTYAWAQKVDNPNDRNDITSVAVNGSTVYVAGSIRGTATLGPLTLTSAGDNDAFVAKLTDAGSSSSFVWAQRMGGTDSDVISSLAVNGTKVYLGGGFKGATSFGNSTLTSAGGYDVFTSRLTDGGASGTIDWVQAAGGAYDEYATTLTLVSPSKVYTGGFFQPPVSFGPTVLTTPGGNNSGAFLASLTDNLGTATTAASSVPALAFYPNPARTRVTVPAATAATILTLTDALGREVRTATGATLPLAGVAPGLYLLRAATSGQPPRTGKLVVE
jgi:hypothetical protein